MSATLTGVLVLGAGLCHAARANFPLQENKTLPNRSLLSVQFEAPGDAVPRTSVGGGTRGETQFSAPGDAAPQTSVGGGTRGDVQFSVPGEAAPRGSVGGGSRGEIQFGVPGDATPRGTASGGSRGEVQFSTPGDGAPQSSASGGTRDNDVPALTALLPSTRYGRTVSARPTFFVYLPPTTSKEVFFSLQDEQGNPHYQSILTISGSGGIVSVTLPENAPELEMGKNYLWFFAPIPPGGVLRPDNYSVTGWVKRVEAPIEGDRNTALNPVELATLYARSGVWYDTLAVLMAARRSQPDNATLAKEWQDLLKQVGLNAIANQPIAARL